MSGDTPDGTRVLSPRANIALLTLQLRGVRQEIETANARADAADVGSALEAVRAKLSPRFEERRAQIDAEMAAARTEAAGIIAIAHTRAAERRAHVAWSEPVAAVEVAQVDVEVAQVDVIDVVEPTAVLPVEPTTSLPTIVEATPVEPIVPPPPMWSAPAGPMTPSAPAGTSIERPPTASTIVIDADSFARAFAAAMAPIIEARAKAPTEPYFRVVPPPAKKSFWAHAWHPDVLLSLVAMIIVLVVLVAWTG